MALTTAQKFKIREGYHLLTIHAPKEFAASLDAPEGVKISSSVRNYDQIHWFVRNQDEMEHDLPKVMNLLKADVVCWIYYPKGSSGIQTDLTRDKGWDRLRAQENLQWLSLVSLDDTWSAFAVRLQNHQPKKEKIKGLDSQLASYIDPVSKTVQLPDDVASQLKKHKDEAVFFQSLAYSHKKEYVSWILSAKRDETRQKRIAGMIDMLGKKWKNPSNN
jgi:Bacteriocin-protection, YdeI or OmpD-Associated